MLHRTVTFLYFAFLVVGFCDSSKSQQAPVGSEVQKYSLPNISAPTLGGTQFWTTHHWRKGWRIQQNSVTGHWRLVDVENTRRAWGDRASCEEKLRNAVTDNSLNSPHAVIYLHGLMRSSRSMHPVGDAVNEHLHWPSIYFEYASTRSSIADHAKALREVLDNLPTDVKLSFVGHSMGNIVLRRAIGDLIVDNNQAMLERFHRVVMLGPPNQGATIAKHLSATKVFHFVAGPGGMELGPQWDGFVQGLAIPPCEFGIIAGNLQDKAISNPLIDEASDFVVNVEETKLEGANDFAEVQQLHSFLMDDKHVQEIVIKFLAAGHF